jgi:site-specific DNA-cytosine methylase
MIQTLSTQPQSDVGVVVAGQFQPKDRDYNKNGIDRKEQFETRSDEVSNTVMTNENKNMIALGIAQRGRENGQEFELNGGEFANTITTVQKDSMIATTQCINSKVNGKQPKLQDRIYDEQGISTAVTTSFMPSVLNQLQIRKLTPRETWRLMGFDDSDFDKASAIHSNSTLYKQAGNSIVVNVLEHILKGLFYDLTIGEDYDKL